MIVAKIASKMIGLLVESISEFRQIPESQLLPPISVAGFPEQLLTGVIAEKDDIMIIPDLGKIFSSYIQVRLLPITAAEKIAFQYRFTPGSLIRTLENTLVKEHILNKKIVSTLPRSMCLPSVRVHKITSYYSDFSPKDDNTRQEFWHPSTPQKTTAGDETYLLLSQQLLLVQDHGDRKEVSETMSTIKDEGKMFTPNPQISPTKNLEEFLHHPSLARETSLGKPPKLPELIVSQSHLAKQFARTLGMSPLSFTKYLSYHTSSDSERYRLDQKDQLVRGLRSVSAPLETRLQELLKTSQRFEEVLQTLSNEQYVLTLRHLQRIAHHYHIPLLKIAKVFLNFPGLSYEPDVEQEKERSEIDEEAAIEEHVTDNRKDSALSETDTRSHISPKGLVSECLRHLIEENKLSDNQAMRAVASRLHVPTCRLSKLRSYYRFRDK